MQTVAGARLAARNAAQLRYAMILARRRKLSLVDAVGLISPAYAAQEPLRKD